MFYKVPKALFTEEKYSPVSTDAKMLYGLLLDRMHLSAKNGWTDKRGRVYQFFTVKEAQDTLFCGPNCRAEILPSGGGRGPQPGVYLRKLRQGVYHNKVRCEILQ